jgi:alcohol dehydrogenase (cytochrome c)
VVNDRPENQGYGFVRAFDMKTGDQKWEYKMSDVTYAGVLSTASDLVFSGGREGYFYALNARTGQPLWRMALGGQVNSGPMSFMVDGKQYIAVAAGGSLFAFRLKN